MNREHVKSFLTKSTQNDVAIRHQKTCLKKKGGITPIISKCCARYEWPSCYEYRWMAIDNFPLWHVNLRHPAGNIPLPKGEPCIAVLYGRFWDISIFFPSARESFVLLSAAGWPGNKPETRGQV